MTSIIENLKKFRIPFFSIFYVYFDIGTSNTRIAVGDKGIIFREPTYIATNTKTKEYIFYGKEAKTIVGKTPSYIKIIRPIQNGILNDFDAQVEYLRNAINTSVRPHMTDFAIFKPPINAVTCVPSIATEIERNALIESLQKSGCTNILLIDKAIATAAGCGFDVFSHEPKMVMDLGGGIIEISIISGGGVVAQEVIKNAGDSMNKQILNYIYLKHGVALGENTGEDLKIKLLDFGEGDEYITVRGKSLESGLPKSIKIKSSDIREALMSQFHTIVDTTRELIENSPPEIADSIYKHGIALSGNIASIGKINKYFYDELQIDSYIVKNYSDATLNGLVKLNQNPDKLYKIALK